MRSSHAPSFYVKKHNVFSPEESIHESRKGKSVSASMTSEKGECPPVSDATNGMAILYVSSGNTLNVVKVDNNGNLVEIVETVDPVVDPLPENADKSKMATEWIDKHPKHNLLYALTSFWDTCFAVLTVFKILENGKVEKLGSCETQGYQAAHGAFSPDGSTYVVSHHNDGHLSFFDATKDGALEKPFQVTRVPVLDFEKFREPQDHRWGFGVPGCHFSTFSPNGKYLIVSECMQDVVFTYPVDKKGRLLQENPTSHVEIKTDGPFAGGLLLKTMLYIIGLKLRVRRAVVHPNGKYLYVLSEMQNIVQVYAFDSETGTLDSTCLQEINVADPDLKDAWWVGFSVTSSCELEATPDCLLVSVRGEYRWGGRKAECSVRSLTYKDGGRTLELCDKTNEAAGVRRFYREKDNTLWVGLNSSTTTGVRKYKLTKDGKFELLGEADVGIDALSVVPLH